MPFGDRIIIRHLSTTVDGARSKSIYVIFKRCQQVVGEPKQQITATDKQVAALIYIYRLLMQISCPVVHFEIY